MNKFGTVRHCLHADMDPSHQGLSNVRGVSASATVFPVQGSALAGALTALGGSCLRLKSALVRFYFSAVWIKDVHASAPPCMFRRSALRSRIW